MRSVARECNRCKKYVKILFEKTKPLVCSQCSSQWGELKKEEVFEACFVCQCRHFYRHKDFNRTLGCLIMLIGILLVPLTYGLSLPILALIDWLLYRKTPDVVLCYRCETEFRGFDIPKSINPFEHHLGDKYQEKNKSG